MRFKIVPDTATFPFMNYRRFAVIASALLLALSVTLVPALGLNFGIDFRGGTLVEARMPSTADLGAIRDRVGGLDLGDVAVQEFGAPTDVLIRIERQIDGDSQQRAVSAVTQALIEGFPGVDIRRSEVVGPKVSGELIQKGIQAVVLAILMVLVYIWLRFEWQFAVGAVVALLHDVGLTLGMFAVLQLEFNLASIAAILTIVGYSLNDTVVVYDRVRENLRRFKTTELLDVLSLSLNETLSRTLMTSVTTLLALFALYFLGGEVLRGFSFAMIWGVVIGTYSSIFIASPILLWLGVTKPTGEEDGGADAGPGGGSNAGVQFGSAG